MIFIKGRNSYELSDICNAASDDSGSYKFIRDQSIKIQFEHDHFYGRRKYWMKRSVFLIIQVIIP